MRVGGIVGCSHRGGMEGQDGGIFVSHDGTVSAEGRAGDDAGVSSWCCSPMTMKTSRLYNK